MRLPKTKESGIFQSTLPVGGGTVFLPLERPDGPISIHPPRGGRDPTAARHLSAPAHFNPPSPWGEGQFPIGGEIMYSKFQSTLPVGGGTGTRRYDQYQIFYFNPPSPWGEGPNMPDNPDVIIEFQSTLPVGGGTASPRSCWCQKSQISIHPPRGGRDHCKLLQFRPRRDFNPPSPWGEGHPRRNPKPVPRNFNPPSPWGEGRKNHQNRPKVYRISIHPPRGGRDCRIIDSRVQAQPISIHPPRGGRDFVRVC